MRYSGGDQYEIKRLSFGQIGRIAFKCCLHLWSVHIFVYDRKWHWGDNGNHNVMADHMFFYLLPDYRYRKKYYEELISLSDALEQKYLTAEIAKVPVSREGGVYFRIMKNAMKSMADEVSRAQRENEEYRDFIEKWIHEIKVPITGTKLICENHKTDQSRKILSQVEQIETDVERVLYYARMGNVEKDYMIKEVSLKSAVQNVLARNKQLLISNHVAVNAEQVNLAVYTDQKWVEFIINQIIINCIKYGKQDSLQIDILAKTD